jgi:hypothetical protein
MPSNPRLLKAMLPEPASAVLVSCLIPDTHFSEKGCRVSVVPEVDEIILFFVIDDQSNPNCALRRTLGIERGTTCDVLVWYVKGNQIRRVSCLVELKGSNVKKAGDQIKNVYRLLQAMFPPQIEWKAYILLHGSAPRETIAVKRDLEKTLHGKCEIKRNPDLGKFLRA